MNFYCFHKQHVMMIPSKEVILLSKDHIVEVTVKEPKSQKRTSTVVSFSPGQKTEKKTSTPKDNKTPDRKSVV